MTPRADYGGRVPAVRGGGVVDTVDAAGPSARAGLRPGDVVVAVDGEPLRDIIDWQWLTDDVSIQLAVLRAGTTADTIAATRKPGEPWGVNFTETVFDGVHTCRNRCAFCFMTQLPPGLRRALYLRDDDYRLSFLQGNFVTLTNLDDGDVERIVEQHLSPLYVSLHAVDHDVREQLVCARDDRALERLDELLGEGIEVHVQIVLVPGVNDGEVLERTLRWLAEREGVLSVGIVPLGYTAHQHAFTASYENAAAASAVIDQVAPWQVAFRERDGVTWVYLADEFYLNAGRQFPPAEEYDDFPQYENGIGLVRDWLDEISALADGLRAAIRALPQPVALLTGTLFAPVASAALGAIDVAGRLSVVSVENRFFGGNVGVTGLLTGADLLAALEHVPTGAVVLVPDVVANADGLLLDDIPAAELAVRSGRDVRLVSCTAAGLLGGLKDVAAHPHDTKE